MAIKPIDNEEELLKRVAEGDKVAFGILFNAYHNQIAEYVMMMTKSFEMTEEIIQDVFVKIWLKRENILEIEKFTAYLFIITRNHTLNCIRKTVNDAVKWQEYSKNLLYEGEGLEHPENIHPDYQNLIDRAILQLPPQQQKVFIMKQSGLKNVEIAKEMGISPDSVKKYQQWAVKSVASFVKAHADLAGILVVTAILRQ